VQEEEEEEGEEEEKTVGGVGRSKFDFGPRTIGANLKSYFSHSF